MQFPPGLRHVIAETHLFTDAKNYVILRLPIQQYEESAKLAAKLTASCMALIKDKDEVTLLLPRDEWEDLRPRIEVLEESPDYRLITFDLPLDLGLVGYLAAMAGAVAEKGVSIFTISAFSRDHVFVPAEDFEQAWDALWDRIRSCRIEEEAERS